MRFLVTNDDGIHAAGLEALAQSLGALGEVAIVAPDRERSATAHAITLREPLRVEAVRRNGAFYGHAVSGTPVDCVKLGISTLMPAPPDFVVAGINPGTNVGTNAIYSGTVSAAIEGAMYGVTSLAISIASLQTTDYTTAAAFAKKFVQRLVAHDCPKGMLFNVNLPDLPFDEVRGVKITRQGRMQFREEFHKRTDPQQRTYYWLGGELPDVEEDDDVDNTAVRQGYISVTPIHYDLTDHAALEKLRSWSFD